MSLPCARAPEVDDRPSNGRDRRDWRDFQEWRGRGSATATATTSAATGGRGLADLASHRRLGPDAFVGARPDFVDRVVLIACCRGAAGQPEVPRFHGR